MPGTGEDAAVGRDGQRTLVQPADGQRKRDEPIGEGVAAPGPGPSVKGARPSGISGRSAARNGAKRR